MNSLLKFFFFTYLLSWIFFIGAGALASSPSDIAAYSGALYFIGAIMPSVVALSLTAKSEGRAGVQALLGQIFRPPVKARWYLFAAGYMAAVKLAVALLHRVGTGEWPQFGDTPFYLMLGALIVSTPFQAGEEIGWRGYALPRLATRYGLASSSIILGIIWASWHLPLFFISSTDSYNQSFPIYLLQVTALSIIMAWLYWRTNWSLLPVMLLHAAINNTKDIVPSAVQNASNPLDLNASTVAWLTMSLLWVCAAYFLVQMRKRPESSPTHETIEGKG